jgi:hypothetical protein
MARRQVAKFPDLPAEIASEVRRAADAQRSKDVRDQIEADCALAIERSRATSELLRKFFESAPTSGVSSWTPSHTLVRR